MLNLEILDGNANKTEMEICAKTTYLIMASFEEHAKRDLPLLIQNVLRFLNVHVFFQSFHSFSGSGPKGGIKALRADLRFGGHI